MTSLRRLRRAFTLVELLVVIGIIAVLIGILLPTLNKARERGRTVSCMSNLRTLYQGLRTYAAENRDTLPFGFTFNRVNPGTGRPGPGNGSDYVTWFSQVDSYFKTKTSPIFQQDGQGTVTPQGTVIDGATKRRFGQVFRCPTVPGDRLQQINYFENSVAMPNLAFETAYMKSKSMIDAAGNAIKPNGRVIGPARFSVDLWPDTALLWDTPNWFNAARDVPSAWWLANPYQGYQLGPTHVDGGQLALPDKPQFRYRKAGDRLYNRSYAEPKAIWIPGAVNMPTDEWIYGRDPTDTPANNDFDESTYNYGGPQFRHNGLGCNVVFADGSVKTLMLNKKRTINYGGNTGYDSEFLRQYLMLKWPGDKSDSGLDD